MPCASSTCAIPKLLPLYARLSNAEQNKVFQPPTPDGASYWPPTWRRPRSPCRASCVIDPGTARISRYPGAPRCSACPSSRSPQASANQRKGRCGRVADGICIRLYDEEDFNGRPAFTDPKSCAPTWPPVILQMLLGLGGGFPVRRAAGVAPYQDGVTLSKELEAVRELASRHGRSRRGCSSPDRSPALAYPA